MNVLQQILWISTTICFWLLFYQLWRTQSFWICPYFTVYIAALCVYYPIWDPSDHALMSIADPILLVLKIFAVIEAGAMATWRTSSSERTALLFLGVALAALGICFSVGFLPPGPWLRLLRQYTHIGIAMGAGFSAVALSLHPPGMWPRIRNHGLILAAYMAWYAAIGFLPRGDFETWMLNNCIFFAGSLGCIGLWLWKGLLVTTPPRQAVLSFGA